ncbi:MAG: YceI family protein [Bacteroidales bacterium]|nr:YceI family protein [Bacteroidales bacterium]
MRNNNVIKNLKTSSILNRVGLSKLTLLFAFILFSISANAQLVDVKGSELKWTGKKVTGEHFGKIAIKNAKLKVENDKITSGLFVIDMNSITCDDIADKETNTKLIGHLKSDDFFGVEKFPESKLVITSSSKFVGGKAEVQADLTIKGKTLPVSFTVVKSIGFYSAAITVNRAKYEIKYGSGSFFDSLGDNMIYDDFTLDVKLKVQ